MLDDKTLGIFLIGVIIFLLSQNGERKVTIETRTDMDMEDEPLKLSGKEITTRSGRTVFGFLGVPYAAPPIGDLRFKSPQPPLLWKGERDATKEGSICLQQNILIEKYRDTLMGDEDCLFLNVFTPTVSKDAKLPVMFFIHGGAYAGGSGSMVDYGPELLLDRDVVLVTINYRLGPLGFLSTGDSVLPGNIGLKDQQAALRWVQENIVYFGGDKNSVTIFGESAGGGSVHLQMLSPSSKGLFHAAISQSGTALSPWAFSFPDRHRKMAAKLADFVHCPAHPSEEFVKCLMDLPAEEIVSVQQYFIEWDMDPAALFNPALEPEDVEDAFLTQDPWTLTSDVPWMVGFNENEGGIKVSSLTQGDVARKFEELNNDPEYVFPMFLYYKHTAQNPKQVTKAIRNFYFGGEDIITLEHVPKILQLHTDSYFMAPTLEAARRHSGPVFLYYFAYNMSTSFSLCSHYFDNPQYFGACHFDELLYIFPMGGRSPKLVDGDLDYVISKYMVELWTNHAENKVPKLESMNFWKTKQGCSKQYLSIAKDGVELKTNLLAERDKFWRDLQFREKYTKNSQKINDEL